MTLGNLNPFCCFAPFRCELNFLSRYFSCGLEILYLILGIWPLVIFNSKNIVFVSNDKLLRFCRTNNKNVPGWGPWHWFCFIWGTKQLQNKLSPNWVNLEGKEREKAFVLQSPNSDLMSPWRGCLNKAWSSAPTAWWKQIQTSSSLQSPCDLSQKWPVKEVWRRGIFNKWSALTQNPHGTEAG